MAQPYYQDDHITIYHGDCREITEWLSGDVMVTDPPYGIAWRRHGGGVGKRYRGTGHSGIVNDDDTAARDDILGTWGDKPALVFGSFFAPAPPFRHVIVWHKPANSGVVGSTTGWRRDVEPIYVVGEWPQRSAAWSSVICPGGTGGGPWSPAGETGHPHTKPLRLMSDLIGKCPLGIVVDPFMGSGTTLRAAKDLGRRAVGIEIDERYCEIAARRMGQEVLDFGGAA